jgi:hypothetical protein
MTRIAFVLGHMFRFVVRYLRELELIILFGRADPRPNNRGILKLSDSTIVRSDPH